MHPQFRAMRDESKPNAIYQNHHWQHPRKIAGDTHRNAISKTAANILKGSREMGDDCTAPFPTAAMPWHQERK